MRILIQGDSHGIKKDIIPTIYKAGEFHIQHVVVTGDFGLWTHLADGQEFLDEVNEAARINNLSVYAIGGNHENWDHWNWAIENLPTSKGFAMIRRRVLLAPKVHEWRWAGKQFFAAGGAVSVDKDDRLARERGDVHAMDEMGRRPRATGPRTQWWPNEQLTDSDVEKVKAIMRRDLDHVDYLITHDCSDHTPWGHRLKPDLDSQIHRQRIDEVIAATKPVMHFHGHMHEQYDWVNSRSHGYYSPFDKGAFGTRTLGLDAFGRFNSWGILDVEAGEWFWPSQYYKALDDREQRKAERQAAN